MIIYIQSNNEPILDFALMAERHCGTNFINQYITEVYNIPNNLSFGHKHFFGFNNEYIANNSKNTLFIGIVRNPYDWIKAMFKEPYHWNKYAGHPDPPNTILKLITDPIRHFYNKQELNIDNHIIENRPYKNIFELREIKNNYLLHTIKNFANNYLLINYEIIYSDIKKFTSTINTKFNINPSHRDNEFTPTKYSIADQNILNIINDNLNWDLENSLNYYQKFTIQELVL